MPLHGDDGQGGMLDAFDDVIAGAADGQQIFARPVEGLMMGGVNRGAETVQLIEEIGAGQAAVIDVVLLIRAVPLVGSGSGDMLDDGAAEGDVDDLHPLTEASSACICRISSSVSMPREPRFAWPKKAGVMSPPPGSSRWVAAAASPGFNVVKQDSLSLRSAFS